MWYYIFTVFVKKYLNKNIISYTSYRILQHGKIKIMKTLNIYLKSIITIK